MAMQKTHFDPTAMANGQILELPVELIEPTGGECSFRYLANFRAAHSQLASYLNDVLFARTKFHIMVDRRYFEDFEKRANSPAAEMVTILELANRHLCDWYTHEKHSAPGRPSSIFQCKVTCQVAKYFTPCVIPDVDVVQHFADLLTNFRSVISVSAYDVMLKGMHTTLSWLNQRAELSVAHNRLGWTRTSSTARVPMTLKMSVSSLVSPGPHRLFSLCSYESQDEPCLLEGGEIELEHSRLDR